MTKRDRLTPSLLEPQSCGGDNAQAGFSFQDRYILAQIPVWLAQEGFTAMVQEGIGDVEIKFFTPNQGFIKELLEAKDHELQRTAFWEEIRRFQEIDAGSPGTYRGFTLVSAGISKDMRPIINGLSRVCGSQDFYSSSDVVKTNSIKDFTQRVERLGGKADDAIFLLKKVTIETDWNAAKFHGEALFKQALAENLKEYEDLSVRTFDDIYSHLDIFLQERRNQCITRKDLEEKLREKIAPSRLPSIRPITIYTAIAPDDNPKNSGLYFDWTDFSGSETRAIAPPHEWDRLLIELQEARTWIENHRSTKRIRLSGNRRLTACLAFGSVFSAVRGYAIDMEYRDEIWATDSHPNGETPNYPLFHQTTGDKGNCLVVSIGICRSILPEVQVNLERYGLMGMPLLDIRGEQPIISPQQANAVVKHIKELIVQNLVKTGSKEVHLFFAGLAPLALFLGHRLDGTAPITCYAWIATGQYTKTCQLFSQIGD